MGLRIPPPRSCSLRRRFRRQRHAGHQTVPGWFSHPLVLFSKDLAEKVGGYPSIDVGEDAQFFKQIHQELGETFIKHDIARKDRFFILHGTSQYQHSSMTGGKNPLDTNP